MIKNRRKQSKKFHKAVHTQEVTGSSPVVSTKKKSLEPLRFQGFSPPSRRGLPFIYPLEQFFDFN